jgi:hypothetical protein
MRPPNAALFYGNGARARIVVGPQLNGKKGPAAPLRLPVVPRRDLGAGARIDRDNIPDAFIHLNGRRESEGMRAAFNLI